MKRDFLGVLSLLKPAKVSASQESIFVSFSNLNLETEIIQKYSTHKSVPQALKKDCRT